MLAIFNEETKMNDKTEALIRELAEKLGTTGENLWSVLVRQAPITGAIDLLVVVAWAFAVVWAFRLVRAKTTKPMPTEADRYPRAEWQNEVAFAAWALWVFMAIMVAVIGGASLSGTIGALVNPEYWALKQVLP